MVADWPPAIMVFIEPTPPSVPGIRRWLLCYKSLALDANNPGSISINLGNEAPWREARSWVLIETLRVSTPAMAANAVVSADLTLGLEATGYTVFEPQTLVGGVNYPTGVVWHCNALTKAWQGERPYMQINIANNLATEDFDVHLSGIFDSVQAEQPQSISLDAYTWPLTRRV